MILGRLLTDLGFEVELAEDGPTLLELLTDEECDLCLVDWNMPGMNGTQVIRTLQAHPDWKDIPAVLVTDETQMERIESALDAGAIGYLPKPFESHELAKILTGAGFELD